MGVSGPTSSRRRGTRAEAYGDPAGLHGTGPACARPPVPGMLAREAHSTAQSRAGGVTPRHVSGFARHHTFGWLVLELCRPAPFRST